MKIHAVLKKFFKECCCRLRARRKPDREKVLSDVILSREISCEDLRELEEESEDNLQDLKFASKTLSVTVYFLIVGLVSLESILLRGGYADIRVTVLSFVLIFISMLNSIVVMKTEWEVEKEEMYLYLIRLGISMYEYPKTDDAWFRNKNAE